MYRWTVCLYASEHIHVIVCFRRRLSLLICVERNRRQDSVPSVMWPFTQTGEKHKHRTTVDTCLIRHHLLKKTLLSYRHHDHQSVFVLCLSGFWRFNRTVCLWEAFGPLKLFCTVKVRWPHTILLVASWSLRSTGDLWSRLKLCLHTASSTGLSSKTRTTPSYSGISCCVSHVSLGVHRCPRVEAACVSEPCRHGGTCVDMWSWRQCQCAEGFTGGSCEKCECSHTDSNQLFCDSFMQPIRRLNVTFILLCGF